MSCPVLFCPVFSSPFLYGYDLSHIFLLLSETCFAYDPWKELPLKLRFLRKKALRKLHVVKNPAAFQGACSPCGCFSVSFCTIFPPRALKFGCLCQVQVLSAHPLELVSWQRLAQCGLVDLH